MLFFSQGEEDSKHNQEKPVLKDESKTTSTRATVTGKVKPASPVKSVLPTKPQINKHTNDIDKTLVKPKVVLPVRNQDLPTDDALNSNKSYISPIIINTAYQRPVAKIEPIRNDPADKNTDPKTVIESEETAVKCPAASNIIQGDVHADTEPAFLGGDSDETLVKTAHTTSQQTFRKASVERPTRSIQSLMPLQALEKSGQADKSLSDNNNNYKCKKQESCDRPLFQAPPFSMLRHSDALTLFYRNTPDVKQQADQFKNGLLNDTVAINYMTNSNQSEADTVRQRGSTRQSVPQGEDLLSKVQGSMNASLFRAWVQLFIDFFFGTLE